MDPLDDLAVLVFVAKVMTHGHQSLFLGVLVGSQDAANARASVATGFSMKICLPAFTAASNVPGGNRAGYTAAPCPRPIDRFW